MNRIKITGGFILASAAALTASIHLASSNAVFAGKPAEYLSYLKGSGFLLRMLLSFIILLPALLLTLKFTRAPEPGRAEILSVLACLALTPMIIAFKYDRILMLSLNNMLFFGSALAFMLPVLRRAGTQDNGRTYDTALFAAAAAILGIFAFYFTHSAHLAFNTATDLAIFANTIWLSANSLPAVTWLEGSLGVSDRLGIHFQPFVYLFTPFFKNSAPVWILLLGQAAAAYGSAVFVYLLGREIFPDKRAAFITGLAYLSSFFLIRSVDFDFHLTPFFSLFFLAFIYFSEKGALIPAAAALILGAATREDSPVYLTAASAFFFLRNRCPVFIVYALLAAVYGGVINLFVMPAFSSMGTTHGTRAFSDFASIFASVKPSHVSDFIVYYLLPFAFIPFLRLSSAALLFIPAVLVYLPAGRYYNTLFFYQYHAMVLPGLFAAFIYASEKFSRLPFKLPLLPVSIFVFFMSSAVHFAWTPAGAPLFWYLTAASVFILIPFAFASFPAKLTTALLAAAAAAVFLTGYGAYNSHRFKVNPLKTKAFSEVSSHIPMSPDVPVIASVNLASRFSARRYVSDPAYYAGNAETLANRVIRAQSSELYMILDRNGSYSVNADKEFRGASDFASLLLKNGYTGVTLADSQGMTAVKFSKAAQK